MKARLTIEERIALAVLLALLAGLVVLGFSVASSQGAEAPPVPKAMPTPAPNYPCAGAGWRPGC